MRRLFTMLSTVLWICVAGAALAQTGWFGIMQACQNIPATVSNVPSYTVSNLPPCNTSTNGQIVIVTNALLPTILGILVGGGGSTVVAGHCINGTGWIAA